jgi:hypothetical protein
MWLTPFRTLKRSWRSYAFCQITPWTIIFYVIDHVSRMRLSFRLYCIIANYLAILGALAHSSLSSPPFHDPHMFPRE